MLLRVVVRLFVCLLIGLLLICTAVTAFGARTPAADESWQHFGFAVCDLPCFAGITPGQTDFDSVPRLLMHHVQSIDPRMIAGGSSINFWAQSKTQQLGGLIHYDGGRVGEMRFTVILPLEQIITELGTPDCLLPNTGSDQNRVTVIFWERQQVSIAAVLAPDPSALNLNANTLALWLNAVQANDCSRSGAIPWRGFAPMWDYLRQ